MKKLLAILLVSIHMFSICGQLVLRQYLVYKTDKFYNEQAAKGKYNVRDLTLIVIPVQLKGINEWNNYENVSGQVQFQHNNYNYVKMKLTRNAMYLMCVPNYDDTHLTGANLIDAKGIKNIPVPKKDHVPNGKCVTLCSLHYGFTLFAFSNPVKDIKTAIIQAVHPLAYHLLDIPEQPPKSFC